MYVCVFSQADVGAPDSTNYTPLMEAVAWKNEQLFREMMDKDIECVAVKKTWFYAVILCDDTSLDFLRVSEHMLLQFVFIVVVLWLYVGINGIISVLFF